MALSPTTFEGAIDQRLSALEGLNVAQGWDVFAHLSRRVSLREEYESVAADYLSILSKNTGSPYTGLKVLQTLETIRARDIGLGHVSFTARGPDKRQQWHNTTTKNAQNA